DGGWLEPYEVEGILEAAGLRYPRSRVVASEEDAVAAAAEFGGPVAVKVISPSALHKSDVGGVLLDVQGADHVAEAFRKVTSAVPDPSGALIQEFVSGGHEVLIGMTQDPNFGPLVAFGLGGVYVELLKDVAFRIHPLTDVDAREMIRETKGHRLLEGYRNQPLGDVDSLETALLRVSGVITAIPELQEMDLNPVKVLPPGEGVVVVDARMRVEPLKAGGNRDLPAVASRIRSA
ncbi:MAG: acetate--CoA ligase family protein, partial [Acidimicrobiales bacterium]|nr:acetate--CoA ligase family protein [Acidimicrobiales bacterium]